MSWLTLLGPILVTLALVILPGLIIALAAGQRGFMAIALSPALSVSVISLAALAGGFLGIRWSWLLPAAVGLLLAALAGCVAWAVPRWIPSSRPVASTRSRWHADAPLWTALIVGALLLMRHMRNILGRPDSFSQTFDNIFHLSATRFIAETGLASPFQLGRMISAPGEAIGFYPTAFHDLASLVMQAFPGTVTLPTNAILIVTVAFIWPAACLALTRSFLATTWPVSVGAGILAASFPAFPILLTDFGVLYPNLVGLALTPALLGLAVQGLRLGSTQWTQPWLAWCLFATALPGLVVAHPNALMTLLTLLIPMSLVFAWRAVTAFHAGRARKTSLLVTLFGTLAFLALARVLWGVVRPDEAAATWPPIANVPNALGQALLNAPDGARAAWLPSILMVVGLLSARRSGAGWLAWGWGCLVGLWLVVAGWQPSPLRTFLTGIWYNDPWRFAAALPLVAVPLATLGFSTVLNAALKALPKHIRGARITAILLVAAGAAALVWWTQLATYMNVAVAKAHENYVLTSDSPLVSTDEYAVIRRAAEIVPAGAVIATNPWNGSSMAWALTGLSTTTTHVFYTETPDLITINNSLDEAASRPATCAAVDRLHVRYVLDFGSREVHGGAHPMPGFDSLATSKGFKELARQGNAALFQVTACG